MRTTPPAALGVRFTPDTAPAAIGAERAGLDGARAMAFLVQRLVTAGETGIQQAEELPMVREALRTLLGRTRHASLMIVMTQGNLVVDGHAVDAAQLRQDTLLRFLHQQLSHHSVSLISIRDGAAPGELLTLARLFTGAANSATTSGPHARLPTPAAVIAYDGTDETPLRRELLRTWSVLVLLDTAPQTSAAHAPSLPTMLARLAQARTDETAAPAVDSLVDDIDTLVERKDAAALEQVVRALTGAIDATGNGGGRLAFEGGLRRLLRPDVIALLASQLPVLQDRGALLAYFARAGEAGTRALLAGLMQADGVTSRRAYYDAIVALDVGGEFLRHLLHDPRWYVARNAASLLGDMGVVNADKALSEMLLKHEDDRLRVAAARALIRLRTPRALGALQSAIYDTNSEVRRIAASSYIVAMNTPGVGRPPLHNLARAFDVEQDEDVALEIMAAMGRLGSADAVQLLLRIAQSPSLGTPGAASAEERGYTPRATWARIAALEALVHARGGAVSTLISSLMHDEDILIADVARRMSGRFTG